MSEFTKSPLSNFIWQLAGRKTPVCADDAQLLTRVTAGDADAFTILVRRYGSLVSGVCHRVLHHTQDAEDACQVTFLVLFRKAGKIHDPDRLAGWLYGVAYRTALHVKADSIRQRSHEQTLGHDVPDRPEQTNAEWQTLLDHEVQRLPERYRLPVVLCYFQGLTHEQAARQLNCPRTTITTRLTRACQRLRQRLLHHGLTGTAVTVAATLTTESNAAPQFASDALNNFSGLVSGRPPTELVSSRILTLSRGVSRTMFWRTGKLTLSVLCALCLILSGTGLFLLKPFAGSGASASTSSVQTQKQKGGIPNVENDPDLVKRDQQILAQDTAKSVSDYPPVVVKTVPQAGQTVDARTTKEIRITFSEAMNVKSYSLVHTKDMFPKIAGKVRFEDKERTIVVPVSLQPGQTYVIWANRGKYMNFQDQQGQRAVPYLLVFATK